MSGTRDGVIGYKAWRPIYVHFHNPVFDCFKQRLRRVPDEDILQFKKLNQLIIFERRFDYNIISMRQAIVANYIKGYLSFPFNFSKENRDIWIEWQGRQQAITKIFKEDLKKIPERAILKYPLSSPLFKLAVSDSISPETVVILDYHFRFLEIWEEQLRETLHHEPIYMLMKYRSFVQFDERKIRDALKQWATNCNG